MDFVQFDDAREFRAECEGMLAAREAENCLLLGIAVRQSEQSAADWTDSPCQPLMCAITDAGDAVVAALMSPPHRLIVTQMPQRAAERLARELEARQVGLPGVIGPTQGAEAFAGAWSTLTGLHAQASRSLRVYELDKVIPPAAAPGRFQAATMPDCDLVVRWTGDFWNEFHERMFGLPQTMRRRILQRQVFLWLDPLPVCMGCCTGPTPNGIRISIVYTPPEHRRHGYATALIAALSQFLLNQGYRFCYLFTDLANPISNSIYQKIGYRPVCDHREFDFPRAPWPKVQ